jgi:hypothetical protein
MAFIRKGNEVYMAFVNKGAYHYPPPLPDWKTKVIKPQPPMFIVIDEKEDFLILSDYWPFKIAQEDKNPAHSFPQALNLKIIMKSWLVRPGDKLPASVILGCNPRYTEIEKELDILRGRIPTPPGYIIDKSKAKSLMAELKKIKLDMGVI